MKKLQTMAQSALLFALTLVFAANGYPQTTQDQFISSLNSSLDTIITQTNSMPKAPLQFSANLFFAHEVMIASFDLDTLMKYVDALAGAGVTRIDINPGLWPWRADPSDQSAQAAIAKYDAIISYIHSRGLKLALNPQYSTLYYSFNSFADWAAAAAPVYVQLAQRYQPDVFVVAHEPTTMALRLGVLVSPATWQSFVQSTAQQIRAVAPRTRLGAGGLSSEQVYYQAFLAIPEIDVMTIDIYSVSDLSTYTSMIGAAQAAGKGVYIEETWRPTYVTSGGSLEQSISTGVGLQAFQPSDAKWLQALTQYAAALGVETLTPFWTQTFFLYVSQGGDALDPGYNLQVALAIQAGARTATYQAFQNQIRSSGSQQVTVNNSSFLPGPVAQDSIVSMFALPGTTLASSTLVATTVPLPPSMGGATVSVKDKNGLAATAPLFDVQAGQVDFQVPGNLASGPAIVTASYGGVNYLGSIQIAPTAPGLYSANPGGSGVAAGYVVRVAADNSQTTIPIAGPDPANPANQIAIPVDISDPAANFVLVLFGTGVRHNRGISTVAGTIGGVSVIVDYAGNQGQYVGEDEIHFRIPKSLIGAGKGDVRLQVGNSFSNAVSITIQ